MRAAADSAAAQLTEPRWQAAAPVFHTVTLPKAAELLAGVAAAHEAEAAAKRAMLRALPRSLPGSGGGSGGAEHSSSGGAPGSGGAQRPAGGGAPPDPEALRARLTAAIAAWLARPFVDDEAAELVLGALTEDMAGF
jgi:hypothetical protein